MNQLKLFLFLALGATMISCSEDDGFEETNGNVSKRYITKITTYGEGEQNISTVSYDNSGKVISASDGESAKYFTYDQNGNLNKISGGGSNLLTDEVLGTIHDAYEIGDVLQNDNNGNPTVIELYEYDYWGDRITHTAHLTYDDKPFTFYYTLDAAGIIKVLNDTRLNFNHNPAASPEIIMAKLLLPVNNPTGALIKDENNQEVGSINVNYTYGEDKYPTSASVIVIDEAGYVKNYNVTYEYKN